MASFDATPNTSLDDLAAVRRDLGTAPRQQLQSVYAFQPKQAVYACSSGVARSAGIDDGDVSTRPCQGQCSTQSCRAASDDHYLAQVLGHALAPLWLIRLIDITRLSEE